MAVYLPLIPQIPEYFEERTLTRGVETRTVSGEEQFQHVWGLLQRQRDIIDRVFNIRANRANLLVYESLAEENRLKLERDDAHRKLLATLGGQVDLGERMGEEFAKRQEAELLTPYHRRRIEGQMREAQARAEYAQEKIAHWELEIRALRATFRLGKG